MTLEKQIQVARLHLAAGNPGAYARCMSGSLRAAMSPRDASKLRKAIRQDRMQHVFRDLDTACPIAA